MMPSASVAMIAKSALLRMAFCRISIGNGAALRGARARSPAAGFVAFDHGPTQVLTRPFSLDNYGVRWSQIYLINRDPQQQTCT